jgi:maleylacetoacetate isomerase
MATPWKTLRGFPPYGHRTFGMLKLYSYWRSSAAYRVRIALNLKGLAYQQVPVHLVKDGGQQHSADYQALNPQQLLPLLVDEGNGGVRIAQSLAILEYLDEVFPVPALLPGDPAQRAQVRALALHIACDIHPLNNLRVLQYLSGPLGLDDAARDAWYRHWVDTGLAAVEAGLAGFGERLSLGERPGYLEACLIPQLYNARRFNCDLDAYPRILAMAARCETLEAFAQAAPEVQPDAQ